MKHIFTPQIFRDSRHFHGDLYAIFPYFGNVIVEAMAPGNHFRHILARLKWLVASPDLCWCVKPSFNLKRLGPNKVYNETLGILPVNQFYTPCFIFIANIWPELIWNGWNLDSTRIYSYYSTFICMKHSGIAAHSMDSTRGFPGFWWLVRPTHCWSSATFSTSWRRMSMTLAGNVGSGGSPAFFLAPWKLWGKE